MARFRHIFTALTIVFASLGGSATALEEDMRSTLEGHQVSLPGDETSYCETDEEGQIVCGEAAEKLRAERKEDEERFEKIMDLIERKLEEIGDAFGGLDGMPSGETVARVVWAGVIAVVVFVTLLILLRLFRRYRPNPTASDAAEPESLLENLERSSRGLSASELANQGDYDAAVHALLLNTLRRLRDEIPIIEIPSTTSREVLAAAAKQHRPPLSVLVALVEKSRFALEPIVREDFEKAEAAHDELVGRGRA